MNIICIQADTTAEAVDGLTRSLPGAVVCISVGVIKASGLQVLYLSGLCMLYSPGLDNIVFISYK